MRSIQVLRDQLEGVARSISALLALVLAAALLVALPQVSSATTSSGGGQGSGSQHVAETTVAPKDGGGSNYVPLPQKNLVDTRNGTGAPKAKLQQGQTLDVVIGGQGGVPTSGVSAVALDLITTGSTNNTPLVVWPSGKPRPGITTHTAMAGENLSNIAFVELGAGGKVSIYNHAGQTDILVTVTGYFTTDNDTGAGYVPLNQVRVADSRSGRGMRQGQLPGGYAEAVTIPLPGVPNTATAAAVTFVLVAPGNGFINAGEPGSSPRKVTASYAAGQNAVTKIVPVVKGAIEVINGGSPAIDVLVDVQGYLSESRLGGGFHAEYAGARLYDSRNKAANNTGTLAAKERRVVAVLGEKGLPTTGVGAVMLQVTVTGQTERGIISVTPQGSPVTSASTLNYEPGQARTNSVLVRTGSPATGAVEVYNDSSGTVEVIIDIVGWFDPYGPPKVTPGDGANYVALPEALLAQSRYGNGMAEGKVVAGTPARIFVAGRGGVPTEGVTAVSLTVQTVDSNMNSSLQLWPSGTARPVASNHTTMTGETLSNIAFVGLGRDGAVNLALDRGDTHVSVFVNGYFTADPTKAGFNAVPQKRIADTRHGIGTTKAQVPPRSEITVSLASAGVPADAPAAAVNLTLLANSNGSVFVGPPRLADLTHAEYSPGQNSVMKVTQIADGRMIIRNSGASPIDVLVDVQGYFGVAANPGDGGFHLATSRVYDSKATSAGALPGRGQRAVPVLGRGDIPTDDVGAVMLSVTVSGATAAGDLLAYPEGTAAPSIGGQLYYESGQARTNTVLLSMLDPATGQLVLANKGANPVHVTVDVIGWFNPYESEIDLETDTDGDSLPDDVETRLGMKNGSTDTDGDGLTDALELIAGTDPSRADSDGNGIPDPTDDPDGDGITTATELTDKSLAYRADTDGDRLDDGREKQLGTNPLLADTDGDGLPDADEVDLGTNPLAADTDGDGTPDGQTSLDTVATIPNTGVTFTATGKGADVAGITVKKLPAQRLGDVPGQRGPPIDVTAPSGKVTGTLTIPFDTTGLPANADLAVLHYNETTGTFDRPTNQAVDVTKGVATVTTDQFSPFLVVDTAEFSKVWETPLYAPGRGPADIVVAVDARRAYNATEAQRIRAFVTDLPARHRVGVVEFGITPSPLAHTRVLPTSDRQAAIDALSALGESRETDTVGYSAGLEKGLEDLQQSSAGAEGRRQAVISIGTGYGHPGSGRELAAEQGVAVYVVETAYGASPISNAFPWGERMTQPSRFLRVGSPGADLSSGLDRLAFALDQPGAFIAESAQTSVYPDDADEDGLADEIEAAGWRDGAGRVYITDPHNADTDGDGLTDGTEAGLYPSGPPVDSGGDDPIILQTVTEGEVGGIHHGGPFGEGTYYKSYSDPTKPDTDADGLEDAQEFDLESHPRLPDTDVDGLTDLDEVDAGFDPLTFDDDGDGRHDDEEYADGSDPFSYDYTKLESAAAAFGGLALGDAWQSPVGRLIGIDLQAASSPWYLVGTLCSGFLVVGDLRDLIYGISIGSWSNAALAAMGALPFVGDTARTVTTVAAFSKRSPQAFKSAVEVTTRVLPASMRDKVARQSADAERTRNLKLHPDDRDKDFRLAAKGRDPRPANYQLPEPPANVAEGWVQKEVRFGKYKYSDGFDKNGNRKPDVDIDQAEQLYGIFAELQRRVEAGDIVDDIRVNQQQVNELGEVVGRNRPDLQYTINGERHYIEFDRPICGDETRTKTRRGAAHAARILKNSTNPLTAHVSLVVAGKCER